MLKPVLIIIVVLFYSCGTTKETTDNSKNVDKDRLSSKIEAFKNKKTFECMDSAYVVSNYEYYRMPMPCICEIVDSVKIGSEKHINYVIDWIENVRITEIFSHSSFTCKTKQDLGGQNSYLRGHKIFEALIKRISDEKNGFQCPPGPDETGLYYPVSQFYFHMRKMIQDFDGLPFNYFYKIHSPYIVDLIDAGKDHECFGILNEPVFEAIAKKYKEGKIKLKPFDQKK